MEVIVNNNESEKYKKLLKFVKKCAFDYHDWDNTNHMSFDASDLLEEIDEFKSE